MKYILLTLIKLYQRTISPDHGIFKDSFGFYKCRFYPTCSEYAHKAIQHEGVVRGLCRAVLRIMRCNGSSCGGHDPYIWR